MSDKKEISQEKFHDFLKWLNSDIEKSGIEYEKIRQRLIIFFDSRNCQNPDELADETINRVILKFEQIKDNYVGDKIYYFIGVARFVNQEYQRNIKQNSEFDETQKQFIYDAGDDNNPLNLCLRDCLEKFDLSERELILDYFSQDKRKKIELRKIIANELGITLIALRMRIYHLKEKLQICINKCME
jgi:hypothetical protein